MTGRLSPLQRELLEGFFRRERRFFLTGGAALAGFHLGHRTTADLDLFANSDALEDGDAALRETARELGAVVETIRTEPDFRRRLVRREDESVVVDLVFDRSPQSDEPKLQYGGVRVDSSREILANKLCAALSRAEIRDLVDILVLERSGCSIESALSLAARKDAGFTPAQLAWVLSEIEIGCDASIPAGVSPGELRGFLADLQTRLVRAAFPRKKS